MPFIYIDRRKAGRGKSSPNRQKLIRRIKSFIKTSSPQNIGQGGVTGGKAKSASPVRVASAALEEPWFCYSNDGQHTAVIIGNDMYDRGDEIEIPPPEESRGTAGGDDPNGEDDFIVNVARGEFLDLFFEDCELPNLTNEKYTEKLDNKFQQAGFSTNGSPAQLSIIRTYKQSLGRRRALMAPYKTEKEELEKELEELQAIFLNNTADEQVKSRIEWIKERLQQISSKMAFLDGFDKSDLRYRKREAKPMKTVDAVLVMIMDISGSMDEQKKTIARRWFALLYAFIKRRYSNTELVFIAHTTEAFEMSEDDFFSTRMNGGTKVSTALVEANKIILERYDPAQTNIYVSHASDGDNWEDDNSVVKDEMIGAGGLLNKIQFFSYVEVGKQMTSGWFNMATAQTQQNSNLWDAYELVQDKVTMQKMMMCIIENADDCYSVFKKVFRKK